MNVAKRSRRVLGESAQFWCNFAAGFAGLISTICAVNIGLRNHAPVAQLDRALVSGTKGRRFESSQARHLNQRLGATPHRPFCYSSNNSPDCGSMTG